MTFLLSYNLDTLRSGTELTTYEPNNDLIDFNELFDDTIDDQNSTPPPDMPNDSSTVNTPQVVRIDAPEFPVGNDASKKRGNKHQ